MCGGVGGGAGFDGAALRAPLKRDRRASERARVCVGVRSRECASASDVTLYHFRLISPILRQLCRTRKRKKKKEKR